MKQNMLAGLAMTVLLAMSVQAQNITAFTNGCVTFENTDTNLYYRVEFRPNLTGPEEWDGTFKGLRNIHSSDPEVTVPVGMFYRVSGRATPWVSGTASSSDILSGKTAYVNDEEVTGRMTNVGRQNITPDTTSRTITQGYHDGTGKVAGDADLVSGNIRAGVNLFGVPGNMNVVDTSSGNATAADILLGKKAWVDGSEITGTLVPPDPAPAPVQETGQTTSYAVGGDGYLQPGVAWPDPRFTDNGDGTVTDNLTELMWAKNANFINQQWWNYAIDDCNNLSLGGHTDWRMPTRFELESLLDLSQDSPCLPSGHPFTNVQSANYWSSTTFAGNTDDAWLVNLQDGSTGFGEKYFTTFYAWPVRGGE